MKQTKERSICVHEINFVITDEHRSVSSLFTKFSYELKKFGSSLLDMSDWRNYT
jgi:hypothetical protein